MIATVTLNPAIDKTVTVPGFAIGKTNRAAATRVAAGGKGINVARVARRMGLPVIAAGLLPQDDSRLIVNTLEAAGIGAAFVEVPGSIRVNLKLIDPNAHGETEINEPGPEIAPRFLSMLEEKIKELAERCSVFVFSGSVPPGVSDDVYARFVTLARRKGARVIVDSSGAALRKALSAGPDLVKPNLHEAEEALGWEIAGETDAARAAQELQRMGARSVVISLGEIGAVAALEDRLFYARPLPMPAPARIGAGDCMVAAFAGCMLRRGDLLDGFRMAMAASSFAAATGFDVADFAQAARFAERVEVEEISVPATRVGGRT